jgi:dihydroflavonol-4-reductase
VTRVLITGGLGFLGSALVNEFSTAGCEVRIFSRLGRRPPQFVHPAGHPIVWGDIRDASAVDRAVEGTDVVVHTVSNFREARTDDQAFSINVAGTDNLLRAAARSHVDRVVVCSTIGVHGNLRHAPGSEESPFNPGDVYQETKVEVERRARLFEQETGVPVCILRPASLYGPGDLRMLKLFRLIQRRRFVLFGKGDAFFHPAYIEDVARGFVLAAFHEAAKGQTFILGGDGYLKLGELIALIAKHLGVPAPRIRLPLRPFEALAAVCEAVCRPFNLEPPLHRRRMSFFRNNRAFTIDKAKRILGYQPQVGISEGLERTILWYEARGLLAPRQNPSSVHLTPAEAPDRPKAAPSPDITRSSL